MAPGDGIPPFYHGRKKKPRQSGGVLSDAAYAITSSYSRSIVHNSRVRPAGNATSKDIRIFEKLIERRTIVDAGFELIDLDGAKTFHGHWNPERLAIGVDGLAACIKAASPQRHSLEDCFDAIGGGGWGPIVTSTLLARGNHTRHTIGTVNAVEFFVTLTASAVFIASIGLDHWEIVLALALGGVCAAPLAGLIAKRVPHRPMMAVVGLLIIVVSGRTLWKSFGS